MDTFLHDRIEGRTKSAEISNIAAAYVRGIVVQLCRIGACGAGYNVRVQTHRQKLNL